jgi:hypothetical protein
MNRETLTAVALAAVLVSGCSYKPRMFTPELTVPPADYIAYEQALESCQQQATQLGGKTAGRLASAGAGIAAGAGAAAIGGAATGGTYASYGAAAAAGSAVIVAVPLVGLAAAWTIGKTNRAKKERRVNEAASRCLLQQGYAVASWKRAKRPRKVEQSQVEPEEILMTGG